eukprot:1921225-Rhodomonas_salina.2
MPWRNAHWVARAPRSGALTRTAAAQDPRELAIIITITPPSPSQTRICIRIHIQTTGKEQDQTTGRPCSAPCSMSQSASSWMAFGFGQTMEARIGSRISDASGRRCGEQSSDPSSSSAHRPAPATPAAAHPCWESSAAAWAYCATCESGVGVRGRGA